MPVSKQYYFPFDEPVRMEAIVAVHFLLERGDINLEDGFDLSDVTVDEGLYEAIHVEFDQCRHSHGDDKKALITNTMKGLDELRKTGVLNFLFHCYVVHRWTLQANSADKRKSRTTYVMPAKPEFVDYIAGHLKTFPNGDNLSTRFRHEMQTDIEVSTFSAKFMVEIVRSACRYEYAPDKVKEAFWHWVANNSHIFPTERYSSYGATLNDSIVRMLNTRVVYDFDKDATINHENNTVVNTGNVVHMAVDYYSLIPVEWLDVFEHVENSYRRTAVADKEKAIDAKAGYTLLTSINASRQSVFSQETKNNRLLVLLAVELAGFRPDNSEQYSMEYPFESEQRTWVSPDLTVKMILDEHVARIVKQGIYNQAESDLEDGTLGIPENMRNYFDLDDYAEDLYNECDNSFELARILGSDDDNTEEMKVDENEVLEWFITYLKLHKKANEFDLASDEPFDEEAFYVDIITLDELERLYNEEEVAVTNDEKGLVAKWIDMGDWSFVKKWFHIVKV